MKSYCKSFDVFDFNDEDEFSELVSAKFVSKFKNPSDKYKLLGTVAQGSNVQAKEISNFPCVDVDAVHNIHVCDNSVSYIPIGLEGEDPATKNIYGLDDVFLFNSTSSEQKPQNFPVKLTYGRFSAQLEPRISSPGAASQPSPGISQLNCTLQESPIDGESVDVISDTDESMSEIYASTSSDIPGDDVPLDGPLPDHCLGDWEVGDANVAVVCPDYIVYRGRYCTGSVLIFSSNCIEMKGSTVHGGHVTFNFQWAIDDIVNIESQSFERLELAMVKLYMISKDPLEANDLQGISGIEELKFAVVDSNWCRKQEKITSLDVRYKTIWNVVFDANIEGDAEALPEQNGIYFPKKGYFPNFDEPFEEFVYPKGDPDAVSVSKRDVDLLQPDTFVNDTIIDFYIKYLENEMHPKERQRFHFFNSFFFRKLIDLDKDPSSAFDSGAAFQRVRKWTRKVNLFEKDYVFIPVNFNYHWSLIVICHPGEVSKFQDEDVGNSLKVPCILHMDSIKGSHTGLKDLVQCYLWEEWKERQKEACEDISSKFFNLRFVPLELPQQQNSFDCGLFLLHYVELFLGDAPLDFSPFKISKFSNFLNVDWFPPAEPSLKRVHIQKLICEILERENFSTACTSKPCASNFPEKYNEIETGADFISEGCSPSKNCHGILSSSRACQGMEITLLPTSSFRSSQCASDSAFVLREFFEAGATEGSFIDGQHPTFGQAPSFSEFKGAMPTVEEDKEADGQFVYSPSNRTGCQQLAGIRLEGSVFPYSSRDFGAETSGNPGYLSQTGHKDVDASPETSICASDDSLVIEIKETNMVEEDLCTEVKMDQTTSPSTENIECLTEKGLAFAPSGILDDAESQYSDHLLGSNGNADDLIFCPNSLPATSHQDCSVQENGGAACVDVCLIGDSSLSEAIRDKILGRTSNNAVSESDGHWAAVRVSDDAMSKTDDLRPAKRVHLTPRLEGKRGISRSLSRDQQL